MLRNFILAGRSRCGEFLNEVLSLNAQEFEDDIITEENNYPQ